MASSTVEDYVKAVYLLQQDAPTGEATVVRLAATLGVTKGSVTAMVRKLKDADLVIAQRYGGVRLTARGERLALDMIRRHRLIEVFLVEKLGFDWSEVHDEAERLEHALSAKVIDRLDAFLDRPSADPHGDPIPDAEGRYPDVAHRRLSELPRGARAVIARVTNQDPSFLEFVGVSGLRPGAWVTVEDVTPASGAMRVRAEGHAEVSLSLQAANAVDVEESPSAESA